jgi:hypothetical protein
MATEQDRNWDKELAEVDKLLAKLPAADPTLGRGAATTAQAAHGALTAPAPRTSGPVGAWLRAGLAAALAIGVSFWPYAHACGFQLFYYLGGVTVLVGAGLWGAVTSWNRRAGGPHVLSLASLAWGFVLAAAEVLPRIGYAQRTATWFCQ